MRNLIGVLCAAIAGLAGPALNAGPVRAGDLPYPRASAPYTVNQPLGYSWAGLYFGGNLGYGWGSVTNSGAKPHGITGGVQGGYNWQYGPVVFGGEADISLSGASDTFAAWKFSNPWFSTVRGRIGYAMNNVLLYGTGGFAFGELRANSLGVTESHIVPGWTAGVGAEVGLLPNWTARFEYLYLNMSDTPFTLTSASNGYSFNVVRLGVNYRF